MRYGDDRRSGRVRLRMRNDVTCSSSQSSLSVHAATWYVGMADCPNSKQYSWGESASDRDLGVLRAVTVTGLAIINYPEGLAC